MLRRALVQCVQVIGEAASQLAPETRASYPAIPWREIRRMRNILLHAYFGISLDILWRTIEEDLSPPMKVLEQLLNRAVSFTALERYSCARRGSRLYSSLSAASGGAAPLKGEQSWRTGACITSLAVRRSSTRRPSRR